MNDCNRTHESRLNKNWTFDQFVEDASNRVALAAAKEMAADSGSTRKSLYIYGDTGIGKTHLMQAAGNHIQTGSRNTKVLFTTAEQFAWAHHEMRMGDGIANFRNQFCGLDLLMIEAVHFLSGKRREQKELLHLICSPKGCFRRLMICACCPPRNLPSFDQRLIACFERGEVAGIGILNMETKIQILQMKSKQMNCCLDDSVLEFLARRITSSIRRLEAACFRLCNWQERTEEKINSKNVEAIAGNWI